MEIAPKEVKPKVAAVRISRASAFPREDLLVASFVDFFSASSNEDFRVAQEIESPNGIADLVFFSASKAYKRSPDISRIQPRWAFTLKSLPYRKQFSLEGFCKLTNVTPQTAKAVLADFVQAGFCEERRKNTWIKLRQPRPLGRKIIAFEAKLKDWQRALKQAYRYQDFAHQSWVLLDSARSEPAKKNLESFAKFNIGLATVSSERTIEIVYCPISTEPRSPVRFWQANAVLAKMF